MFFSITRTVFSHSRSEQFWSQNTIESMTIQIFLWNRPTTSEDNSSIVILCSVVNKMQYIRHTWGKFLKFPLIPQLFLEWKYVTFTFFLFLLNIHESCNLAPALAEIWPLSHRPGHELRTYDEFWWLSRSQIIYNPISDRKSCKM